MIDDAMEFLDSMAHDVDLAFGQTHGGATRVRDKSNPDRFGNGHSAEAKRISLECKKLRRVVRFVHKKQLNKASQLCVTLAAGGIELPDVHEDESAVIDSATSILKRKRLELQGRNRAQLILNSGGSSAKSQESKQRAATKRDVNAAMERSVRGAVASVTVGAGDAAEVLTDPLEVARECCEWSDRRMSLMQPKWFRRLDVAVGHAVWVADGAKVIGGLVHAIDNDGHYTVKPDTGALLFGVRRETLCLKWQVGSTPGAAAAATRGAHVDGDSRRRSNGVVNDGSSNIGSTAVPKATDVRRLAAMDRSRVDDTALLFRRGEAGRRCRARAVKGELTQDDITQLPSCFHELLEDLQSPVSGRTGATVQSSDFANMVDELGAPRPITSAIMRRKLGKIAKGKAPGFSGNGPDLYASLPDSWVEWAVELANIIQFTQITPRAWHIDLVHYVHKGGSDGSLSNHRPLALVEVFRKVFTSIICDRMKRDFAHLLILDPTNPGFASGRTTANSIFPLRAAAEHCRATGTEFSCLLDDLKWCFDTPASTVIELGLMRLGVPAFYANLMADLDVHMVRSTVTASGTTVDLAGLYHRQLHGTGQGTVEGPINWIPIADIVIAVVRRRSRQPVALPTGGGKMYLFDKAWFVDDSGLGQAGDGSTRALQYVTDGSGLMYYFLGLERRGSKCLWAKLRWAAGELVRRAQGEGERLMARAWLACWHECGVHIIEQQATVIKEYDYDEEFKHLGYSASLLGGSSTATAGMLKTVRRAASVFQRKPSLRHCGASIMTSVLRPKLVYALTFSKTPATVVDALEGAFGVVLRNSLSVARGFPWDVLAGAPEYEGLGYSRLTTEVTKGRLRLFQSMAVSKFATENDLGRAMTQLAQRWAGSSTPVNMMHLDDLRLLQPLDGTAPQSAHMFYELRSLGYSLAVGWRCEPLAYGDATIYDALLDAAGGEDAVMTDDELASFQAWRRAAKVMWVSELLCADGRTLRSRFDQDLQRRARNCEADALRLCMVAFGHGRTRPARHKRVGIPKPALWTVLEVGDLLWRHNTVCEITLKNTDSACVRVRETFFDLTASSTVYAFAGHDTSTIPYADTPLRIDTATVDSHGVVHVSWTEVLMLRDVEAEVAAVAHGAREPPQSASSDSDGSNVTTADGANCGILDYDCIAETQQMLPWGSQYRNIVSREGHAWVLASLDSDPQVVAAALAAEDAARQLDARNMPSLLAYSDGSVIADGIEGSAAAVIRIGGVDVSATIRLAAADRALSSGRSEWAGLLLVQAILRRVRADVTLRLDNLQVVNKFDDGEERFAHDWMRQNERDMASLAWELAAARERRGLGSIKVLHQLGHPEKRKAVADYDEHERYNVRVDALTHAITPDMPLYISFRRTGRRQTQLWYEPTEHENVGHGTCHEVTGDVYRHITKSAQRRASIGRIVKHCGEFHATFERGIAGRSRTERAGPTISKILNNHLSTESRVNMWGGAQSGTLTCACGHVLQWSDRDDVGPLQWHFLQCTLAEETSVRKRWRAAIKRTIVAAASDLVVAEKVIACWTHLTDGTIHTSAGDQASDWRPPTLAEHDRDGGWDFVPSGVQPSFGLRGDHSGFSSDDDSDASDAGDDNQIVTANGTFSYTEDWNHIERSRRPTIAAANLLHLARQRTDTSRWWSMRWPSDAVSLVGRSLNLDTGRTYKLMLRLREHSVTYLTKLWQLTLDRADKRDNAELRRRLQIEWAETKRRLGTHGRNAKRQLMPGWVVVAKLPVYKIKHQLAGWKRVRMTTVLRGGQRTITSFLTTAPPPCAATTRTAATAPLTSDANRRTQTTIPFARAQLVAERPGPTVTDRQALPVPARPPPPPPPPSPLSLPPPPSHPTPPRAGRGGTTRKQEEASESRCKCTGAQEPRLTAKKSQAPRRHRTTHAHCPHRSLHREATTGRKAGPLAAGQGNRACGLFPSPSPPPPPAGLAESAPPPRRGNRTPHGWFYPPPRAP